MHLWRASPRSTSTDAPSSALMPSYMAGPMSLKAMVWSPTMDWSWLSQ